MKTHAFERMPTPFEIVSPVKLKHALFEWIVDVRVLTAIFSSRLSSKTISTRRSRRCTMAKLFACILDHCRLMLWKMKEASILLPLVILFTTVSLTSTTQQDIICSLPTKGDDVAAMFNLEMCLPDFLCLPRGQISSTTNLRKKRCTKFPAQQTKLHYTTKSANPIDNDSFENKTH